MAPADGYGVRYASADGVGRITIDRPSRANAIDSTMIVQLEAALAAARADDGCRVLVIRGAGGRHFCAGADRRELKSPDATHAYALAMRRVLAALRAIDRPTLACVTGAAAGFGAMIALDADLLLVTPDASVSLPEMQLGIAPDVAHEALDGRVLPSLATWLMLTGSPATPEDLANAGVKLTLATAEALDARLGELVATLSRVGRDGMATLRRLSGRSSGAAPTGGGA